MGHTARRRFCCSARFRSGLRGVPAGPQPPEALGSDGGGSGDLARILGLLKSLCSTAVADTAVIGFREAADFAADVEEIARRGRVSAGGRGRGCGPDAAPGHCGRAGSGSGVRAGGWLGHRAGARTAVHGPIGWVTGTAGQADSGPGDSETGQSGSSPDAGGPAASGGREK